MARRIVAALKRTFADSHQEPEVHFHQGANGQAAVCHVAGCENPRLDVG